MVFGDSIKTIFGVGPVFTRQRKPGKSHFEMGLEFVFRQISFEPPTLFAFRIEEKDGRRPKRIEAPEIFRVLFDVYVKRNEIFVDE